MNTKGSQFTRQNPLLGSVPCGDSSWMVLTKSSVICASRCSWDHRLWPAGVAVQVLSFLTPFSRTRKWLKCMRTVWCFTRDLCRMFSAAISIIFPFSTQCFWLSVGLWVWFFFDVPLFLPVLQTSGLKMSVSCIWDVGYLVASGLDIVATLLAIRAFCASKLQFWVWFDLRNVLLLFFSLNFARQHDRN